MTYFQRALSQAQKAQETLYEINVLVNIALLHESQENTEQAIEYMEKALVIDPENAKIQEKIQKLKGGKAAPINGENGPKLEKNRVSELTIGSGRKGSLKSKTLNEEALMVGV